MLDPFNSEQQEGFESVMEQVQGTTVGRLELDFEPKGLRQ
jgi:hypothetical protein